MRPRQALATIIGCFSLCACANTDVIVKRQAEMDARLEQLIQGNSAATARLAEMTNEVKELQAQVKANSTALEELKAASRAGSAPPAAASQPRNPQTPRIEVVNTDAVPNDRESTAQDAYMKAFGLFSANNYNEAVMAFESFIRSYPGSEYAGNAQYWIGECYYTQSELPKALEAFRTVISSYPNGKKTPDAMLKVGFTLYAMKEPQKGRAVLEELIGKYPDNHHLVAKAKERINRQQ